MFISEGREVSLGSPCQPKHSGIEASSFEYCDSHPTSRGCESACSACHFLAFPRLLLKLLTMRSEWVPDLAS